MNIMHCFQARPHILGAALRSSQEQNSMLPADLLKYSFETHRCGARGEAAVVGA